MKARRMRKAPFFSLRLLASPVNCTKRVMVLYSRCRSSFASSSICSKRSVQCSVARIS